MLVPFLRIIQASDGTYRDGLALSEIMKVNVNIP